MKFKYYDTCSLLKQVNHLFDDDDYTMVISSISLEELENIKTSNNKDISVKSAARQVIRELNEHYGEYIIDIFSEDKIKPFIKAGYSITNDIKIIAGALSFKNSHSTKDTFIFVTNDLICYHIASLYFETEEVSDEYEYEGFVEVELNDEQLSYFYSHQNENMFELFTNEYLLIYDNQHNCVDQLCWTGSEYRKLTRANLNSTYFGNIKPMKNDEYQILAVDSLINNKITMIKGFPGSGKTTLSLAYLMHKLEKGQIDKIIIFCNTVATKNSARLGFYPGDKNSKLLDSQIGNLLSSKLGGKMVVEQMLADERLVLLPMSDIRGYDTSGMRAGIYISEAQNLDIELMKLALQRIGEDSVCIIDGDCKAQVDDISFAGVNNGMKRVSQVFRGENIYGEITLKNIHRSRIALIAERL